MSSTHACKQHRTTRAAAAATATATATTAAAKAAAATAAIAGFAVVGARRRDVETQLAAQQHFAVARERLRQRVRSCKVDVAVALGAVFVAIKDQAHREHFAVLLKQLAQIVLGGVIVERADEERERRRARHLGTRALAAIATATIAATAVAAAAIAAAFAPVIAATVALLATLAAAIARTIVSCGAFLASGRSRRRLRRTAGVANLERRAAIGRLWHLFCARATTRASRRDLTRSKTSHRRQKARAHNDGAHKKRNTRLGL